MPNLPNRNNRRKGKEHSETLIIPHITKEMLEKARSMAEQGASRAEIEQALAQMQGAPLPDLTASTQPAAPDPHRIIPKSRPRHTQEERQAMQGGQPSTPPRRKLLDGFFGKAPAGGARK